MQRTQIYLPRTQLLALKEIARRKDATTSEVVRLLIGVALKSKNRKLSKKQESLQEAGKRIGVLGIKGPKDLAKNMDKYLYGSI
jgi:hypothetical protein